MVNGTDKELTYGQAESSLVTNTLEDGKMVYHTDKEHTLGQMEENTLENIKMVNGTDKELTHTQMEINTLENS